MANSLYIYDTIHDMTFMTESFAAVSSSALVQPLKLKSILNESVQAEKRRLNS